MQRSAGAIANPTFNSVRTNSTNKNGAYTATANDSTIRCDASAGTFTVGLPAAATVKGLTLAIKKVDSSANAVTIDPSGSEVIDGQITMNLNSQWQSVIIQSNGASWDVLSVS